MASDFDKVTGLFKTLGSQLRSIQGLPDTVAQVQKELEEIPVQGMGPDDLRVMHQAFQASHLANDVETLRQFDPITAIASINQALQDLQEDQQFALLTGRLNEILEERSQVEEQVRVDKLAFEFPENQPKLEELNFIDAEILRTPTTVDRLFSTFRGRPDPFITASLADRKFWRAVDDKQRDKKAYQQAKSHLLLALNKMQPDERKALYEQQLAIAAHRVDHALSEYMYYRQADPRDPDVRKKHADIAQDDLTMAAGIDYTPEQEDIERIRRGLGIMRRQAEQKAENLLVDYLILRDLLDFVQEAQGPIDEAAFENVVDRRRAKKRIIDGTDYDSFVQALDFTAARQVFDLDKAQSKFSIERLDQLNRHLGYKKK